MRTPASGRTTWPYLRPRRRDEQLRTAQEAANGHEQRAALLRAALADAEASADIILHVKRSGLRVRGEVAMARPNLARRTITTSDAQLLDIQHQLELVKQQAEDV
ncbi:hypothetical protein FA95DRAFT_1614072 [Auriscalpium vulgare]|uniref:Uncharacterized protein n=1 Tax=Auriscalpium vulgare TaxID=40419 RepID=A0ACB8R0Z5_9AGAM|nr:hypothetical protein FA95DRAFT_1614072 [Auriscalpium vulgare]